MINRCYDGTVFRALGSGLVDLGLYGLAFRVFGLEFKFSLKEITVLQCIIGFCKGCCRVLRIYTRGKTLKRTGSGSSMFLIDGVKPYEALRADSDSLGV